MKMYTILATIAIAMSYGLFHYIEKVGQLKLENEIMSASIKQKDEHIEELGVAYANLNAKYYELEKGHEEIQKFEGANLSKVPVDVFINDWNIGVSRVLKDHQRETERFYSTANSTESARSSGVQNSSMGKNE